MMRSGVHTKIRVAIMASIALLCVVPASVGADISLLSQNAQNSPTHDRQCRADIAEFVEAAYCFGENPTTAAADRMIERARNAGNDGEILYWASVVATKGWASHPVNDGPALLQRSADLGYAPAIRDLGISECVGVPGVPQDANRGIERVRQVATTGDAQALYDLAGAYANGLGGLKVDLDMASHYLQESLDKGYLPAATSLAEISRAKGDLVKAEEYWIQAAEAGDVRAMHVLVDPSVRTATSQDQSRVYRYLTRGCIWGDAQMERMFASRILLALPQANPDHHLAQYLLQSAADQGDVWAMALQARARLQGLWYTAVNMPRGRRQLEWFSGGVDQTGVAAFLWGQALWKGAGVPQNQEQGIKLIRSAASAGFKPAQAWVSDHQLNVSSSPVQPTTYPSAEAELLAAMRSLQSALVDVSTAVDDPHSTVLRSVLMPEAAQIFEDDDDIQEALQITPYPLPRDTISRIMARSRNGVSDVRTHSLAALMVSMGIAGSPKPDDDIRWIYNAARSGDTIAMSIYGGDLLRGYPVKQDVQQGLNLLRARPPER